MEIGETLSIVFGVLSNGLWLFVFIPTLILNYRKGSSEALSFSLLFCLIVGDIFSILSAKAKDLGLVIIYSAVYHIILDFIVVSQILYYRMANLESELERVLLLDDTTDIEMMYKRYIPSLCYLTRNEGIMVVSMILTTIGIKIGLMYSLYIAEIVAWCATLIFIIARIPQIYLNWKRRSTEGLSMLSFIIINVANMCFLISILVVLTDLKQDEYNGYIIENVQWIIGCTCTIVFDAIIFYQFKLYNQRNQEFI